MKQADFKPCVVCGKGVMHDNNLTFYQVSLKTMMINPQAVQRQHGFEMMMGSPRLAQVMGTNEDMAHELSAQDVLVCQSCALDPDTDLALLITHEEDAL